MSSGLPLLERHRTVHEEPAFSWLVSPDFHQSLCITASGCGKKCKLEFCDSRRQKHRRVAGHLPACRQTATLVGRRSRQEVISAVNCNSRLIGFSPAHHDSGDLVRPFGFYQASWNHKTLFRPCTWKYCRRTRRSIFWMDFMPAFVPSELGWRPDLADPRDYRPDHQELGKALGRLKRRSAASKRVDWREYLAASEDRTPVVAGTARACVSLLQYFQRRATGESIEPSLSFVDYTARRLLARTGDGGEELRATWKAIIKFGCARAGLACGGRERRPRTGRIRLCRGGEVSRDELRATGRLPATGRSRPGCDQVLSGRGVRLGVRVLGALRRFRSTRISPADDFRWRTRWAGGAGGGL